MHLIWKVCAVRDIPTVRWCRRIGVDMVGIHAIDRVAPEDVRLFDHLRTHGGDPCPVLVTKTTSTEDLVRLVSETRTEWLQIHAPVEPEVLAATCTLLQERLGTSPNLILVLAADDPQLMLRAKGLAEVAKPGSLFLLDTSWRGGTGRAVVPELVRRVMSELPRDRFLLAGGLNPENVAAAVKDFRPAGVDVQSGVELGGLGHRKDPFLLMRFACSLGRHPTALPASRKAISLALTDLAAVECTRLLGRFQADFPDSAHLDYSDGSAARVMGSNNLELLRTLRGHVPCLPYDVHLFGDALGVWHRLLDGYVSANPLLESVFVHCGSSGDMGSKRLGTLRAALQGTPVRLGLAIHSPSFERATLSESLHKADLTGVDEILVVTHSRAHAVDEAAPHDAGTLAAVREFAAHAPSPVRVGLDRDITLAKLRALRSTDLDYVVVGRALREAEDPEAALLDMRRELDGAVETGSRTRGAPFFPESRSKTQPYTRGDSCCNEVSS